jgi:hypothetical protein
MSPFMKSINGKVQWQKIIGPFKADVASGINSFADSFWDGYNFGKFKKRVD